MISEIQTDRLSPSLNSPYINDERANNERERKRLKKILDNTTKLARIGVWEVDVLEQRVTWDRMTREIHEVDDDFEPDVQTGINFYKTGSSKNRITFLVNKSIKSGAHWDEELELVTAKGNERWVRVIGQAEFEQSKCIRLFGIFQDITEQKKIQEDLTISVEQFKGAFDNSAIGMALVSVKGEWLKVNKRLCEFLGYTSKELYALTFQDITHPDDLEIDLDNVKDILEGRLETYYMEKRYFHKNGSIVWVMLAVSLVRDSKGTPMHFVSQIEDITKRKKAERDLLKVNQELNAILDSGHVSIIGTDIHGRITHFSKGAEALLGYSAKEMLYISTPTAIHSEREIIERGIELSKEVNEEIKGFDVFTYKPSKQRFESRKWTYIRKDGTTFPAQLVVTAIRNEQGSITGYLGIATDISELEGSRQSLKEAHQKLEVIMQKTIDQNEQLSKFAHITSHNLRAPVSNLNSLLQIHKETKDEDEKALIFSKFDKVILHLSETLNELIEALKIRENVDKAQEDISLTTTVEKVKEILAGQVIETKAKITTDFSANDIVHFNAAYLDSIIQNLLANAIKYRSPERIPEIHLETSVRDEKIVLSIRDNGLGIDLEKHGNKLFGLHKTFHRHKDAKGVGLFLVKTQIEALGGIISAHSKVNQGTTFEITFKLKP